jgi:hypothetical protein
LDDGARLERLFARLDHGFALLAALIINRSGGIKPEGAPATARGTPAQIRSFLWDAGPEPVEAEPEATLEGLFRALGGRGKLPEK